VFLVEGYFDVLAMSAASAGPALGIMSTSLHAEQIRRLARLVQKIVLLLDATVLAGKRRRRWRQFSFEPR
jgi:DNA primase